MSDEYVEQRILEAIARAGPRAVVTGWAGLRLWGGGYFDGLGRDGVTRLPVPIATNGERLQHHEGILASRYDVPPDEIVVIHGMRVASVERCLFDEMRRVKYIRAMVVPADMTFAAELTSIRRMRRYRAERRWYRDVRIVDEALDLCDENAWSPREVDYRLVWECDAGWGHPLCNRTVVDLDDRFIGVPDVIDPRRGVAGEFLEASTATRTSRRRTSCGARVFATWAWRSWRPSVLTSMNGIGWFRGSTPRDAAQPPAQPRAHGSWVHPCHRLSTSSWTSGTVERRESALLNRASSR